MAVTSAVLAAVSPPAASAQLTPPCRVACGAVLGATAFVAATGSVVAVGRVSGGLPRLEQGIALWGASFTLFASGGLFLEDDGGRQRRAVYGAGLGALAGSAAGLALEALRDGEGPDERVAGALVGAAAGALVGGVLGALTYEGGDGAPSAGVPLLTVRLPLPALHH